ncbi:MAG: hypothetical protein RMM51_11805 [Verrucomicrobiae bacterium]|nr:hypothetical protein [Verrucomicrobiae bacterium]
MNPPQFRPAACRILIVLCLIPVWAMSRPAARATDTNTIPAHEQRFLEAVLLMQRGLYAEAEQRLQQLLTEFPDNPTLKEMLQEILRRRGSSADSATGLREQLQRLIVPALDARDQPIHDLLEHLRALSRQLDPATNGVNIVWLAAPETAQKRITLTLRNVPLGEVLRYVAQAAGVQMHVEPYAVVFRPFPPSPAKPTAESAPTP